LSTYFFFARQNVSVGSACIDIRVITFIFRLMLCTYSLSGTTQKSFSERKNRLRYYNDGAADQSGRVVTIRAHVSLCHGRYVTLRYSQRAVRLTVWFGRTTRFFQTLFADRWSITRILSTSVKCFRFVLRKRFLFIIIYFFRFFMCTREKV